MAREIAFGKSPGTRLTYRRHDGTQVTFDADNVYVNFLGFAGLDAGAFVSVDVSFGTAAVPEPSTLAGCGLIAVALAGYRLRRRAKAA